MIQVWHWVYKRPNSIRSGFFGFKPAEAAKIAHCEDEDFAYVLAATVDTDDFNVAYDRTNNIDKSWTENKGVEVGFGSPSLRSTSMGDMLVRETERVTVAVFGFKAFKLNDQ